jgi:hypothetical protein
MSDLHEVIEQSIDDIELPLEDPEISSAVSDDNLQEVTEPVTTASDIEKEPNEAKIEEPTESTVEVQSPAARTTDPAKVDDFEKRFGIPQNATSGRENRIPYSRVKKITEKAIKEEATRVNNEYTPKVQAFETQIKDYQAKVSDYEGRLVKVAEFERIMLNDVPKFLGMLSTMPQYSQFLAPLFQQQEAPTQQTQAPAADPNADMPQPDQELSDGSRVYSMEGLAKLNAWNRDQARKQALDDVEKQYGGMRREWEQHQLVQRTLPKVQAQIEAARKWDKFTENEQDIVRALQADQQLSLEGAYNKVVVPKINAEKDAALNAAKGVETDNQALRDRIRAEILKELKTAPRATSASGGGAKPNPERSSGPRSLESVIEEAMKSLK